MLCTCVATCSSALRIPLLVCFTPVATLFYSIYLLTHLGIISGVNTQMLALYNAADTAEAVSLTCLMSRVLLGSYICSLAFSG